MAAILALKVIGKQEVQQLHTSTLADFSCCLWKIENVTLAVSCYPRLLPSPGTPGRATHSTNRPRKDEKQNLIGPRAWKRPTRVNLKMASVDNSRLPNKNTGLVSVQSGLLKKNSKAH